MFGIIYCGMGHTLVVLYVSLSDTAEFKTFSRVLKGVEDIIYCVVLCYFWPCWACIGCKILKVGWGLLQKNCACKKIVVEKISCFKNLLFQKTICSERRKNMKLLRAYNYYHKSLTSRSTISHINTYRILNVTQTCADFWMLRKTSQSCLFTLFSDKVEWRIRQIFMCIRCSWVAGVDMNIHVFVIFGCFEDFWGFLRNFRFESCRVVVLMIGNGGLYGVHGTLVWYFRGCIHYLDRTLVV